MCSIAGVSPAAASIGPRARGPPSSRAPRGPASVGGMRVKPFFLGFNVSSIRARLTVRRIARHFVVKGLPLVRRGARGWEIGYPQPAAVAEAYCLTVPNDKKTVSLVIVTSRGNNCPRLSWRSRMDPSILHGVDNHFLLHRCEPSHILRYKPHACLCIELPHLTRRLLVTLATRTSIKADSFSLCVPRLDTAYFRQAKIWCNYFSTKSII